MRSYHLPASALLTSADTVVGTAGCTAAGTAGCGAGAGVGAGGGAGAGGVDAVSGWSATARISSYSWAEIDPLSRST